MFCSSALPGLAGLDIVSQGLLTRVLLPRLGAEFLTRWGLAIDAIGFASIACVVFVPRIEFLFISM
jgi:MFS transporter, DHA1 family, tetracycline resistance protein